MNVAKTATAMSNVNDAAVAALPEPALPVQAMWPSVLRDVPARMRRLHHPNLPQPLTVADEEPLIETGAARGFFFVLAEIAVSNGPIGGIVASPASGHLLVTNHGENCVSVIETGTFAVVNTITGTDEPFVIAAGRADDNSAYVSTAAAAYDSISVIDTDTNTVVATHPVALNVRDLAVSPDGKRIYASRTGLDGADVAVIDTARGLVTTIDIATGAGVSAEAMSITRDGLRLYVATVDQFGGYLVVIDTGANRVVDTIEIGSPIRGVALSPGGDTAYVASFEPGLGGVVDVVDTATNEVTATVEIGGSPTQLTLSSEGDRAYVVSDDHIAVLCTATNEVIDTITVGAQPSCVTESPDGKQLYVADYTGRVTVLSVASSTAPLLARVMALDVIAAPELLELLELEPATV